jgi:xanthine dehydrogenase molybdopterin-binding subunit B
VAAHKFKKPVRLILTRKEDISITGQRHESLVEYKVSADKSTGKICSAKFKAYCNGGISTGKSLSKALILLSINPKYDDRFEGELAK